MAPPQILLLVGLGLAAGVVAGLLGIGGGSLFGPLLLFYFSTVGVGNAAISKLTVGSSLLCTFVVGSASAYYRYCAGELLPRVVWRTGACAAVAVVAATQLVTTQPWYNRTVFQIVLGTLLVIVGARMVRGDASSSALGEEASPGEKAASGKDDDRYPWPLLAGVGTGAGIISPAAGVGGGVVLVPAYHRLLGLPINRASGTSSGTIILISLVGVVSYAASGWGASGLPGTAVGYVDVVRAALLAGPSILGARLGVWAAGHIPDRTLRWAFVTYALSVAGGMFYNVWTG
jgi:uncharacterized membrane protein YfcA